MEAGELCHCPVLNLPIPIVVRGYADEILDLHELGDGTFEGYRAIPGQALGM